ncbi:glucosamine inositolphosphorylceramide transferase family protein [Lysobacter gummosus]|uniref:Glucosamine inositolphosphorylceramide transferase 1 N-terminal domain-containing protein n=1 Tax=Lysobacter gummosus TaxID=262324 RepID=A0ABY3XBP5_9GAMM|nr:hypothetical protein [Lysobacter gummosus]ALN92613.1 hypothetical protein LG3211_3671 [Lysobacter gummosus]UNP28182.1 hypothetical protein MOV92_16985 [Lysobacter gummosus]
MSDFEDSSAARVRIAVLLPAVGGRVWQEYAVEALRQLPGVDVEIRRVDVEHAGDARWRRLQTSVLALRESSGSCIDPEPGDPFWNAVIDLAGIDDPNAWRACSMRGVWQPLDAQGTHLAAAYPCLASITSGTGGELLLVRNGDTVVDSVRFFADPRYTNSLENLYKQIVPLLSNSVRDMAYADQDEPASVFSRQPRPTRSRRAVHEIRGRALALRRRLKAQWLSESWMIGVIDAPIQHMIDQPMEGRVRWIGPRESMFYRADPFGVPGDDRRVYCEVYDYRDGFGRIEAVELGDGHSIVDAAPAQLKLPGHISYPYLFEHEGRVYAVPETAARKKCELYEIDKTGQWRFVAVLLDGVAAADASLFVWNDLFWLAYTDLAMGPFDNLCLSYSEELRGPWKPHLRNPVKVDHRSSRPAGTPFVHEGVLYRPAQDCGSGYGQAAVINRVSLCTPQRYREEVVRHCRPDPCGRNPHGLHTVSAWGERTLVDGKRYVFNLHELTRKLRHRREDSGRAVRE